MRIKKGDLIITKDEDKLGIVLMCEYNWFGQERLSSKKKPNLFYIGWLNKETRTLEKSWHKIDEQILKSSTIYKSDGEKRKR